MCIRRKTLATIACASTRSAGAWGSYRSARWNSESTEFWGRCGTASWETPSSLGSGIRRRPVPPDPMSAPALDALPAEHVPHVYVPLSVPNIGATERAYVDECLRTGWVSTAGPFVERFEREFAAALGVGHAVTTASGTAALHTALLLAGVQPEDEVVVPSLPFIAPANAVRYVGAWPTFLDVDQDYWQLDPHELRAFLRDDCKVSAGELQKRRNGRRSVAGPPGDTSWAAHCAAAISENA